MEDIFLLLIYRRGRAYCRSEYYRHSVCNSAVDTSVVVRQRDRRAVAHTPSVVSLASAHRGKTKARTKELSPTVLTMNIPWSDLGIPPAKGMKFDFNVYAQYGKDEVRAIWEYNPFQRTWHNPYDRAGTLILE